jgi:uncharacterized membrane protein
MCCAGPAFPEIRRNASCHFETRVQDVAERARDNSMDYFSPAQLLGYLAFFLGVAAYVQRIDKRLLFLIGSECLVYTVHFYLLGNNPAAISALITAGRSFIVLKTRSPWVAAAIVVVNVAFGLALTHTVAGAIPIAATIAGTVAVFFMQGIRMRLLLLLCTLCWLTNNILSLSIGGMLLEAGIALANATTIIRLWRAGPQSTGSMGKTKKKLLPRGVAS